MTRRRKFGSAAAIGGSIAAIVLLAASSVARADELADLRANQELLQKRIDQLSQAPPPAPGQFVPGFGAETRPPGAPVTTGSFPRSFLIPGTDTSLRIGGFANGSVLWYLKGATPAGALNSQGGNVNQTYTDGQGGTGNLPIIPLNNTVGHSRSSGTFLSGKYSRLLFDARTPTAWGEAKAYIELDFAVANTNTINNNQTGVSSGFNTRFRKGYATLGGLLAGQESGILHDPDADPELADTGGMASSAGRSREAQVKYTYQGPYGTVWTVGIENPVAQMQGTFGSAFVDTNAIPGITACSVTGNTAANLPATTACLGNAAFFDPLKSSYPELIGTARINQPWGHLQIGVVVRNDQLNDGQALDQSFVGYGGTISGDVHPFSGNPGPLGKDDLGVGMASGNEIAGQIPNGAGLVTNFGRTLNVPGFGFVNPLTNAQWNTTNSATRRAYDQVVRSQSPNSTSGWIWYQHWWTNELRSTVAASAVYNSINTNLVGQNTTNNKLLSMTHANLFWSPVAFIDLGAEYAWGHRVTVANFKGDAYTIQGMMRVRF